MSGSLPFGIGGQIDAVAQKLQLPFGTGEFVNKVLTGTADQAGRRSLQILFATWDVTGGGPFAVTAAAGLGAGKAVDVLLDLFLGPIFEPILRAVGSDDIRLRATLCVSQIVGIGILRYNVKIDPIASMPVRDLVDTLAPTINRYVSGELRPGEKKDKTAEKGTSAPKSK